MNVIRAGFLMLIMTIAVPANAEGVDRHYLFVGQPSPEGWRWLMNNPGDRRQAAEEGIRKLGGEMLSYFWGANDGRNYITVRLPADSETVPAMLIMRLSSGLLTSYQAIELLPSDQMPAVLKRIGDIMAVDDLQSGEAEE